MATTTTLISPTNVDPTNPGTDAEKYARIVRIIHNMTGCKHSKDRNLVVPLRTTRNPSLLKKTAANRHPGQTHTRTPVDDATAHELAHARYLMQDLADHVVGHIVSTSLARDMLLKFVEDKVIQVFEGTSARNNYNVDEPLGPNSDDIRTAIQQAFEDADKHDCVRPDAGRNDREPESPSADTKRKRQEKAKTYSFRWTTFPTEPLDEDEFVSFLNDITDRAFDFAKPKLAVANPKLRHRFASPEDKTHAVPLSYEPDGEDMRPDFLLLPVEAFLDDFRTVDPRYVNFTASRLVGESKNKDLAAGLEQMQRYARGLKRAQPWVYYVFGMAITKDKAVLVRGEGSGTECLELMLENGRGCIDFIRILLGLALADKDDLGHNPDVELDGKDQACVAKNITHHSKRQSRKRQAHSVPNPLSRVALSKGRFLAHKVSAHVCSASAALCGQPIPSSSTSTERAYSEIEQDGRERIPSKKRKTDQSVEVNRHVFYPVRVYGYKCLGILFTASSIRGRGTTVFCVVDFEGPNKGGLTALEMAWRDLGRAAEQDAVMAKLNSEKPHPNVIVPIKTFNVKRNEKPLTTFGTIRGFLDEQLGKLHVENRVLTVSISELKRPVKYFWGVHDFVRGLRGALLGHEYVTTIGILHRDISENNIVLGLRPGDERGYLIDFDMAILQTHEEPTSALQVKCGAHRRRHAVKNSPLAAQSDNKGNKPVKGLRTGTLPYISYNVLWGRRHTHFDDVESFLYVLLLFFFSYAGPLSVMELHQADESGFVQSVGSGRLPHTRSWPKIFADWADGDPQVIAEKKYSLVTTPDGVARLIESPEFMGCLENNWPEELHNPICDLIEDAVMIFRNRALIVSRTEVTHATFISLLGAWLDTHADLEDKFSNCPEFEQARSTVS